MGNTLKNKRISARRAAGFLAVLGALVMSSGVALMVMTPSANAAECVPQAASVETINHPAVTHVVHHDAVEAVPSMWWNFAPNDNKEPLQGEPAFPTDPRGSWGQPNIVGGPGQDQTGTFQQGQGNASWFHRTAAVAAQPASDETIIDKAAWVETINHPAVTCDVVSTPTTVEVAPPAETKAKHKTKTKTEATTAAVTPTVVHAGLSDVSVQDVRGEQGLALMFAGMVMLAGAGGLGLRLRRSASRI